MPMVNIGFLADSCFAGDPLRIDQVFPGKKPEMSEDLSERSCLCMALACCLYLNIWIFCSQLESSGRLAGGQGKQCEAPHVNAPEVSAALGISFYTFQIAAYAIDVYRGQVKPEERFC